MGMDTEYFKIKYNYLNYYLKFYRIYVRIGEALPNNQRTSLHEMGQHEKLIVLVNAIVNALKDKETLQVPSSSSVIINAVTGIGIYK